MIPQLKVVQANIGQVKKGGFHKWLGKSEDEPITEGDIQRGLNSDDPHVRKMAGFARNSRKWKHKSSAEVTASLYPVTHDVIGPLDHWEVKIDKWLYAFNKEADARTVSRLLEKAIKRGATD